MRRHAKAIVAISALLSTLFLGASIASAAPPVPTMGTVSDVSYASAHVTGTVDPADQETYYSFERSTDGVNWSGFSFEGPISAGAGVTNVEANLTGLKGGTEYFIRLSALNFAEFNEIHSAGPNPSFTTLAVDPPAVLTIDDATDPTFTTAKASGSVERPAGNPDPAFDANCRFEYVTDAQFGATGFENAGQAPCDVNPVTTSGATNVSAELTGLDPGTTYHLRLVAENAGGSDAKEATNTFDTVFAPAPTATLDPVADPTATSAELTSQVNPNGTPTTAYFEYSDDGGATWLPFPGVLTPKGATTPDNQLCNEPQGCPFAFPVDLGEGGSPVDFDRLLTGLGPEGLEPNTDYEVRLRAKNVGGETVTAPRSFRTEKAAPFVQALFAGPISADSATLAANLNPHNSTVTYQFEWGGDDSYGNVAPAAPSPLGAIDNDFHRIATPISGLQPATTYHFRLVATNTETSEATEGQDHSFTTAPAPLSQACPNDAVRSQQNVDFLPHCRAYEKVSAQEKNALDVETLGTRVSSPDGSRVIFMIHAGAPGAANGLATPMLGQRGPNGWTSRPNDAPRAIFPSYSEDITKSIADSTESLSPGAPSGGGGPLFLRKRLLYVKNNLDNTYELGTPKLNATENPRFADATPDLSRFIYETISSQTEDAVPPEADQVANLYLYDCGDTRFVGRIPPSAEGSCGGSGPTCIVSPGGSLAGSGSAFGTTAGALSDDGKRVAFHITGPGTDSRFSTTGPIFTRFDDGVTPPTTQWVNASERTVPDPAGPLPALYWDAEARHGSKILFSSCEKLTNDSVAEMRPGCDSDQRLGAGPGEDLYLYDAEANDGAGGLTDLTVADPSGAKLQGVVGTGEDFERIYFVAGGVLAPGALVGRPNLYLWHSGAIRFITTLQGPPQEPAFRGETLDSDNWGLFNDDKPARVSPDGRYLLFTSRAPLTGFTNASPDCFDGRCTEIYLYDADADGLACISCNSAGAPAEGEASLFGSSVKTLSPDPRPRNLDPAGHHVFFETADALSPQDTNDRVDVYGWFDGEVRLISSAGPFEAQFLDATPDGKDVFFVTRSVLTGSDGDRLADLYDARVNGGFLETPPPAPCSGDGCRDALSSPPASPGSGTSTFSGPGNPKASRCAKGKVRRNSRCVSRKNAKKHAKKKKSRTKNDRRVSR